MLGVDDALAQPGPAYARRPAQQLTCNPMRNALLLLFVATTSVTPRAQETRISELPRRDQIARVEIVRGLIPWYTPDELLSRISEYYPTGEKYIERQPFQYGRFILKSGKTVEWRAANAFSIAINTGSGEKLFKLNENDPLFLIWDKAGKEGYINSRGQTVIKPQFDKVTDFSEGLAAVLIGEKWGYINRGGVVIIKPRWKPNDRHIAAANPFKEGTAVVVEYATWAEDGDSYFCGYIDTSGHYIVKPQLRRECRAFNEGLAWVVTDERDKDGVRVKKDELNWGGYIDKKGAWIIKPELYRAGDFVNGIARVRKYSYPEEKWYFIDKSGSSIPDKEAIGRQEALKTDPKAKPALVLKRLKLLTIGERPDSRNIYGYENGSGKYVWLSPDAERHLDEAWIRENFRSP